MDYAIYIIFGALLLVYLVVFTINKKGKKRRKSRQFMDGKQRHKVND
jgi:hypothetical protein